MTTMRGAALRPRAAVALRRFSSDPILRSSVYLTLTTAVVAAVGFVFWLLNSRLFSAGQIGLATTLISGATLISYISQFGFNMAFIRFLPTSRERDAEINTGLLIVFVVALAAATLYLALVPAVAPRLTFVRGSFGYAAGFVVLSAFWAVNLVTDSIFIAFRKTQYNLLVDGFIQGAAKLALPALLVGLGAYGVFMASGLAAAAAVVASVLFLMTTVHYRPKLSLSLHVLRRTWDYSAANYVANLLNLSPVLVVPLIVLDVRGPGQAAFYFIAFQVASLLFAVAYAVSLSFFAESSHEGADVASLLRHSAKILAYFCVPGSLFVAVTGHWLLLLFGHAYSAGGTSTLAILALSTPSVALCSVATTVLRVANRLLALVVSNAVYAIAILGFALIGARHGLQWVAVAYLVGNTTAGLLAAGLAAVHPRSGRGVGDEPLARAPR